MNYLADLHTHSTASDGQHTPSKLVQLAHDRGLEVLALTDHDTVAGIEEAVEEGKNLGVKVVPGIELSAREYHIFHILGYGFSIDGTPISKMCVDLATGRWERAQRIVAYLAEKGMNIDLQEVAETAGGVIGRPHFAQVMLRHGYVGNDREAFNLYLDTDEYYEQVELKRLSVRECIDIIKDSGGKASLAHPYQIGIDNEALDTLVRELKGYGLDAIECYYPRFTVEQAAFYRRLAEKYGLYVTGGSDFHGEKVKPDIELATLQMDLDWLL